jgi:hypothetical protein
MELPDWDNWAAVRQRLEQLVVEWVMVFLL